MLITATTKIISTGSGNSSQILQNMGVSGLELPIFQAQSLVLDPAEVVEISLAPLRTRIIVLNASVGLFDVALAKVSNQPNFSGVLGSQYYRVLGSTLGTQLHIRAGDVAVQLQLFLAGTAT